MGRATCKRNELIIKAGKIREREHRLRPALRLKTPDQMVDFIHQEGLVSTLGGNELPNMISAVLGRSWKPSSRGFTGWLDWWPVKVGNERLPTVLGQIERREDVLASRIFRSSKTLVSSKLWLILDPIVERHKNLLARGEILSAAELRLIEIIESEGSVRTDRLRREAKLEGKGNTYKFHRYLTNLEGYGLIVGAEDPQPERHMHANIWQTWEKRTSDKTKGVRATYEDSLLRLLESTIRACVLVHENDVQEWYRWDNLPEAIEKLVSAGPILRTDGYLVSSNDSALT